MATYDSRWTRDGRWHRRRRREWDKAAKERGKREMQLATALMAAETVEEANTILAAWEEVADVIPGWYGRYGADGELVPYEEVE